MDCSPPGSSVHFGGAYMVSWPDLFCKLVLIRLFGGDEGNFRAILYFALLLLSRFSCVQLCATPQTAAHQALPSLGFSRQEQWSGLPFPSPMQESEKWKWTCSVVSDFLRPHGLQPTRLLWPWDFPSKNPGVGCHCRLQILYFSGC